MLSDVYYADVAIVNEILGIEDIFCEMSNVTGRVTITYMDAHEDTHFSTIYQARLSAAEQSPGANAIKS